ncbi:MAG: class I SAM-dependent methyltransferase [Gammaproteobacteria bacterium]|nr:class I SAM-dependent methyltransferase [Gammaproteobacteria bacterium]
MSEKMHSRELGLVLAQQLLGVDDLHYGLWGTDLELTLANVAVAQQRYTDLILADLPTIEGSQSIKVIDIGCGTGHILAQMLDKGYEVDGVIPASYLADQVQARVDARPGARSQVFRTTLQDLPLQACNQSYDVALFSESFQYMPMHESFSKLKKLLKPGGRVIICDFFSTKNKGDGGLGDGSFGGGHQLHDFYNLLEDDSFRLIQDHDITELVSPNLDLVNDVLMHKLGPAGASIGRYVRENYPKTAWIISKIAGKKFKRAKFKYFSGLRTREVFERYKNYRHIILELSSN